MNNGYKLAIILSLIAIILSIISIYMVSTASNNQNCINKAVGEYVDCMFSGYSGAGECGVNFDRATSYCDR